LINLNYLFGVNMIIAPFFTALLLQTIMTLTHNNQHFRHEASDSSRAISFSTICVRTLMELQSFYTRYFMQMALLCFLN